MALFLAACGALSGEGGDGGGAAELADPDYQRTPPPLVLPATGSQQQTGGDGTNNAMVDTSNVADGYIGASCTSPNNAYLRVQLGGEAVDYRLDNTGIVEFFPLSMGDGGYQFTVMVALDDGSGSALPVLNASASVTLSSEFAPFLVASQVVNYNENSESVALSYELCEHASSNLEIVQQVYAWVAANVSYDTEKATWMVENQVQEFDYIPEPDATIADKKGICYDYASLVAAMLRANGVPCQLAKGQVKTPTGQVIGHAWNYVWLEEEGWIATEVPSTPAAWAQIDLTYAASGSTNVGEFIGSGDNYALDKIQ